MNRILILLASLSDQIKLAPKNFVVSLTVASTMLSSPLYASCEIDVSHYVGWGIIFSGTVTGYTNEDGEREDDFEGCEYGRRLLIDHNKAVTCQTYSYSYSYHPDIVILKSPNGSYEACIDGDMYDISLQ